MNAADELDAAVAHVIALLRADVAVTNATPGGIWDDNPPADILGTYLTVGVQAGTDTAIVDGTIVLTEVLIRVLAVTSAPSYPSDAAAAAHAALHGTKNYDTPGGRIHACHREQALRFASKEPPGALIWRHTGGIYRLTVGPNP